MSYGIIASLALSLLVVWFVLSPLFEPVVTTHGKLRNDEALGPLFDAKERALRALKDLEMDFSMGKLSQEDFEQSKGTLTGEVASILADIERLADTHGGES